MTEHQNTRTPEHQNTRTPEHHLFNVLKLIILFWMLMKTDVGWGQLTAPNLIANPDITVDLSCDYGWVSFFEGCVNSWQSTNGTPHHVRWHFNQCFEEYTGAGRITNCLYSMCVPDNDETNVWNEAIYQTVNIIKNDFITYDLGISLNLLRCDNEDNPDLSFVNAPFGLRFANDLTTSDNVWEPIQGTDFEQIITQTISSFSPVTISMQDIVPDRNFSNIQLYVDLPHGNNNIGETQIEINNIELKCNTSALVDITYNFQTQRFEAVNADLSSAFTSYYWTLPDNTNSPSSSPFYLITESGKYNVCLDVLDIHGCLGQICKTINIISTCKGLLQGYYVQSTFPSTEIFLSTLVNHPTDPIPHMVLPNGTIQIKDINFELSNDLIIDVKSEFLRTKWYCNGGTMIDIRHDLVMKNTTFEACAEMWKGFKHKNNRRLNMNDCVIKDAEFGIEMSDNAKIWSRKDVFEDCYIGVLIPEASQTQNIVNSFIQTDFLATNPLKLPYNGQINHAVRMYTGIRVLNTTNLNVRACDFVNLLYSGIHSGNSSINCSGSTFNDEFNIMRGIQVENNGPIANISGNTFQNVYIGLFNDGIRTISKLNLLHKNKFFKTAGTEGMTGIFIRRNALLETKINNNLFDMNLGTGMQIWANNNFTIDFNTLHNRGSNEAFKALQVSQNFAKNSIVSNNDVYTYEPIATSSSNGFEFSYGSNLNVIGNDFYNLSNGTDGGINIGVAGIHRSVFRNNNFFNKQIAFNVQATSNNNLFCCNTSTEPGNSINVVHNGISDFRNNTLHTLRLESEGEIGQQDLPGNRWENNGGMNTGTLGSMIDGTPLKAQNNRIFTDPNQGVTYRPDDVDPVVIEDEWFRNISPQTLSNCVTNPMCKDLGQYVRGGNNGGGNSNEEYNPWNPPIGDPPRRPLCDKVMTNYFNYFAYSISGNDTYPNQTRWNMNDYLLTYIDLYGQSFFDSCIQNSVTWIGQDNQTWFDAEKDKEDMYKADEPFKTVVDDLLTTADSISNEINIISDTTYMESDSTVLQVLYDEFTEITNDISEISEDINDLQRQKAMLLLQIISGLPEPHGFLTARKKVWEAEVKCFLNGVSSVTPQEWQEIRQIMLLCPYEAGKVVTEAKALLLVQLDEIHQYNYSACQGSTPRTGKTNAEYTGDVFLYPNPAKNFLQISAPEDVKIKEIKIKNVHGLETFTTGQAVNIHHTIDISSLSPGVYFYEIKTHDVNKKYHGKLLVIE